MQTNPRPIGSRHNARREHGSRRHLCRKCVALRFLPSPPLPDLPNLLGEQLRHPAVAASYLNQADGMRTFTQQTQLHLDRCLTCRSCETTSPSAWKWTGWWIRGATWLEEIGARDWRKLQRGLLKMLCRERNLFCGWGGRRWAGARMKSFAGHLCSPKKFRVSQRRHRPGNRVNPATSGTGRRVHRPCAGINGANRPRAPRPPGDLRCCLRAGARLRWREFRIITSINAKHSHEFSAHIDAWWAFNVEAGAEANCRDRNRCGTMGG